MQKKTHDTILLLDGLYLIRRADIKFASKKEDDGKQSFHIVYNFFRSLRAIIEELEATKVFFCCESERSIRKELYSKYKANRLIKTGSGKTKESEEDFYRQADIVLKLLKHLPIVQVKANGYEADDVIATLVEDLKDEKVIIVSEDKDFTQLLQKGYEKLTIYNPKQKAFAETPDHHMLTFLCVNGDSTDNVPKLLSKAKALDLATDSNKFAAWLSQEENRANYQLNKQLVELKPIDNALLEFDCGDANYDALKQEFEWMEFESILKESYWERFVGTFEELR